VTPDEFIKKWKPSTLKESSGSKEHFIDLCNLLGEPTPGTDATGQDYCFERGAVKTTGTSGWADVWKRGCFGWEYKSPGKSLQLALAQLQQYAPALDNPPLLIVSDIQRIRIHTNWTNTVAEVHEISLEDLRDGDKRQKLKWAMSDPEHLKPSKTRQQLTESAATDFAKLAIKLNASHPADVVAHFLNRLVFCMFAEDVGLLPNDMFTKMLRASAANPAEFQENASTLFRAMAKPKGKVGYDAIEWFNGGLFDDDRALPLDEQDIEICLSASSLYWNDIDPSILGTLFERGLDPAKRSQLGAHYTDRDKIMMIVRPVIIEPLLAEWASVRHEISQIVAGAQGKAKSVRTKAHQAATRRYRSFLERLRSFRVLDPACGSGNFLYLALRALKDIEHRAGLEVEEFGLQREFPEVGPSNVMGLELNAYAAELARVTVWIGEIQWMRSNGFDISRNPILKPLQTIANVDALLDENGDRRRWPDADVIIGNPPFLGAKLLKRKLGVPETLAIRRASGLPGFTDLVCYWYEHAHEMILEGRAARAGLVATNSIRKNTNLPVLRRIAQDLTIFEAWSEEKWTVEGATVDVSLICFGHPLPGDRNVVLNGEAVEAIFADLTSDIDLTQARPLNENRGGALLGIQKSGPFDVPGAAARSWIALPTNPNGHSNSEVLRPYWNGDDITGRPRDQWFIDLPLGLSEQEASLYQAPFEHLRTTPDENGVILKDLRLALQERAGPRWWEPHWPRPEMRARIADLPRYIVTPETAEYRLFVWIYPPTLPDKNLIIIPRSDDLMFGILHSRFHEAWALRKGSDLQDRPRYTHTTTFATFPFPEGFGPGDPAPDLASDPKAAAIAKAAAALNQYRQNWLNPPEHVIEIDEVAGLGKRLVSKDAASATVVARRTLTALYNEKPSWLDQAHRNLDGAVAAAYGWPEDISTADALFELLALNLERSA